MRSNFCRVTWSARCGHMIISLLRIPIYGKVLLPALKQRGLPGLGRLVTRYVPTPSHVPNSQFRAAFSNWHQFCMQVLHHPQALLALCTKHILHRIFVCEAPAATISPVYAAALQTRASDVASCNPSTRLLWHHFAARARLAGANAGVASCSPNTRLARARLIGAA